MRNKIKFEACLESFEVNLQASWAVFQFAASVARDKSKMSVCILDRMK
jgi:hypothetical protein